MTMQLTSLTGEIDEHLAHTRVQTLTDLSAAIRSLEEAAAHVQALRDVDIEFAHGRDGRDVATHIDDAIRSARAGHAVIGMIVAKGDAVVNLKEIEMSVDDRPQSGEDCICCRNHGLLPAATLDGRPIVNMPGLVDGATIRQCCDPCVGALFFGGIHPHGLNPLLLGSPGI